MSLFTMHHVYMYMFRYNLYASCHSEVNPARLDGKVVTKSLAIKENLSINNSSLQLSVKDYIL